MDRLLSNNKGVTLVEVLISIPLVALLLSGILSLLSTSVNSYQTTNGRMAVQQTALSAVDSMVRELQLAQPGSIKLLSATKKDIEFINRKQQIIKYSIATSKVDGTSLLMRSEDAASSEPITGENSIPISITTLVFSPVNTSNKVYPTACNYPLSLSNNIVSIELVATATSYKIPTSYTIKTTVTAIL